MDLEGFAKRKLREGEKEEAIIAEMCSRIMEIKRNRIRREDANAISRAILEEAKRTIDLKGKDHGNKIRCENGRVRSWVKRFR